MLNIQPFALNDGAANRIRKWLGADGAADFMGWLHTRAAILTAEAGNCMVEATENPSKADDARLKAAEAAEIRRMIERINKARVRDFVFERCEITPTVKPNLNPNPQT